MASISHLKRTSMPNSWPVKKKNITFIGKPNPGSHKRKYVVSALILLREQIGYAATSKEAKQIIYNEEVLLNGKRITDIKTPCGIFDIFEIKKTSEKYIILFDKVGKINLVSTKDDLIYLRIASKKVLSADKFQLNFMNGYNLLIDKKTFTGIKVQDTIVFDYNKKKIMSTLNLKAGNFVYIFDGKFKGNFGILKEIINNHGVSKETVTLEIDGKENTTIKEFCYVIGSKKEDLKRFN